jgi:hypothetical protein
MEDELRREMRRVLYSTGGPFSDRSVGYMLSRMNGKLRVADFSSIETVHLYPFLIARTPTRGYITNPPQLM